MEIRNRGRVTSRSINAKFRSPNDGEPFGPPMRCGCREPHTLVRVIHASNYRRPASPRRITPCVVCCSMIHISKGCRKLSTQQKLILPGRDRLEIKRDYFCARKMVVNYGADKNNVDANQRGGGCIRTRGIYTRGGWREGEHEAERTPFH